MERWEEIVDNTDMPSPGQHVFIWGAGNTSVLNHQGMLRENLYKEFRVEAFLDSKLAGTVFNGFQVFHPDILRENAPQETFVFISTTNEQVLREIEEECREINISYCLLDAAILKVRKEKYLLAVELMKTDSGSVYHTILRNRLLATGTDDLYAGESCFGIPEFCRSNPHDVVVDCGAYVGDSAERYIWRMPMFHKYIAIEPDLRNFQALQRRFNRLREEWGFSEEKLVALHGGVDEKSGFAKIDNRVGGLGSIAYNCSNETVDGVRFWALDDLFPDGYTFLKADIESFEYRMICGAKDTIRKYHPRMAICIYHNMVDMYSIPLLIHEIDPSYRLAIRHHSYGYEETVLYAY